LPLHSTARDHLPEFLLFSGGCSPTVARQVRQRFTTAELTRVVPPELTADMVLVATELLTNAYSAGAQAVDVVLRAQPPYLELRVTDDADGFPTQAYPASEDSRGRGLMIIASLAEAWGYDRGSLEKTVWARFSTAP
jgi:two-component sensor histidine kinase